MPARRPRATSADNRQVFINCPFSQDYLENFRAIVFAVIRSGYEPRCALEADDGSQNRLDKICALIAQCRLSVHDISKTEPDVVSGLPRFNMPLELGLFLGAKRFGSGTQRQKRCIILDQERYRYQKFISDIAGQDIHTYDGMCESLIGEIASWLRQEAGDPRVPGGRAIGREFREFQADVPKIAAAMKLEAAELTFQDYRKMAVTWISKTAAG